ncbi:ARP6 actin-related protein-like protein 6 [Coemansia reversa NRRL 1564]|uniref:Actin-like protein ARP6 n=1 Tax=Coemansia reversa (strain ATCC 12441 / NRRL 1564) TaxID=763665 RepID=A0A2G5BG49_COERN|nr:ARP6 actin-related protein-like protein 6 [Coemansia reversa NRRL 1564]|eukprot:PIA17980.1 ARP6 actin-related protein-like protein 6 [Coemansia reversa NRRL 1564]
MQRLILDNGSFSIKCGYADSEDTVRVIPNSVVRTKRTKRIYIGDQIDTTTDLSGLYYRSPFERGYLLHWDAELAIWDRTFRVLGCKPSETSLFLSEPVFNFKHIQRATDEIVFEEYQFANMARAPVTRFSVANVGKLIYESGPDPECTLVVDVGHAFSYVVPYHNSRQISAGIRRVDVGGRILTNYLKETVSFRYWDMMDETYIMNAVKEQCCFVSQNFKRDLETTRGCIGQRKGNNPLGLEYVLPDFTHSKQGFIKGQGGEVETQMNDKQLLPLCNERFAIPEALFHPSDIGLEQGGLHQAVVQAVNACPEDLRAVLLANIVLVGGGAALNGLKQRLQCEIQAMVPYDVRVNVPDDPTMWAWRGGCLMAKQEDLISQWQISREQYQEMGVDRVIAHYNKFV